MDLDALEALERAATKGLWRDVGHSWPERAVPIMRDSGEFIGYVSTVTLEQRTADAALIAAARNALPALIADARAAARREAALLRRIAALPRIGDLSSDVDWDDWNRLRDDARAALEAT
jgi:hypothetical protein